MTNQPLSNCAAAIHRLVSEDTFATKTMEETKGCVLNAHQQGSCTHWGSYSRVRDAKKIGEAYSALKTAMNHHRHSVTYTETDSLLSSMVKALTSEAPDRSSFDSNLDYLEWAQKINKTFVAPSSEIKDTVMSLPNGTDNESSSRVIRLKEIVTTLFSKIESADVSTPSVGTLTVPEESSGI